MVKKIQLKVKEHIIKKGMSQKYFAQKADLREATLSLMINNKYERIQLDHILKLMEFLQTDDFNEIFEIVEVGKEETKVED